MAFKQRGLLLRRPSWNIVGQLRLLHEPGPPTISVSGHISASSIRISSQLPQFLLCQSPVLSTQGATGAFVRPGGDEARSYVVSAPEGTTLRLWVVPRSAISVVAP